MTNELTGTLAARLATGLDTVIRQALELHLGPLDSDSVRLVESLRGRCERRIQRGEPDRYFLYGILILEIKPWDAERHAAAQAQRPTHFNAGFDYRIVPPAAGHGNANV